MPSANYENWGSSKVANAKAFWFAVPTLCAWLCVSAVLPAGWTALSGTGKFTLGAGQVAAARIEVNLPGLEENKAKKPEPQEISVHAESSGQSIGEIKLRVELRKRALPQ